MTCSSTKARVRWRICSVSGVNVKSMESSCRRLVSRGDAHRATFLFSESQKTENRTLDVSHRTCPKSRIQSSRPAPSRAFAFPDIPDIRGGPMGQLLHYRRDIRAALDDARGLSFEERGALDAVLDLIYLHGGAVEDDEDFIVGALGCDRRPWRRLRDRLIALGRIYAVDGTLRNARADREVDGALARRAIAQAGGLASGESRRLGLRS